ncbi:MAG: hypothetical protein LBH61_04800 [Dysgonamonadaceae bacterium]|nr:hypothetical protein [Dysgonamonadaceae bacterium]
MKTVILTAFILIINGLAIRGQERMLLRERTEKWLQSSGDGDHSGGLRSSRGDGEVPETKNDPRFAPLGNGVLVLVLLAGGYGIVLHEKRKRIQTPNGF